MPRLVSPSLFFFASSFVASPIAFVACQQELDRDRPPIAGCETDCGPIVGGPGSGQGGEGGEGGGAGDESVAITGRVVLVADDRFDATVDFVESAVVRVRNADDTGYLGANYDGVEYSIDEAELGTGVWMAVEPAEDVDGYLLTIARADTTSGDVDAPIVSEVTLTDVFTQISIGTPVSPSGGHLVVRVVDASGDPVEGVTIEVSGAGFVGYSEAGTWVGGATETTADGLAFVGNVPAGFFPGNEIEVGLTGSVTRLESAVLAAGAVTIVTYVVGS